MRIHWKRPRFRILLVVCVTFLVSVSTLWLRQSGTSADAEQLLAPLMPRGAAPQQQNFPPEKFYEDDPGDEPRPREYSGPFPDARVPEGRHQPLVDYHNHSLAKLDGARAGLGEQGQAAKVPSGMEKEEQRLYNANGFNGLLSDLLPLDRSLSDIRHSKCSGYKYYQDLPTVSVIIPFFEEQLSALQRTVLSVVNRSPRHLLREIILVDDGSSTRPDLNEPLEQWLRDNAPMTKVLRLQERQGLITARQAGAKEAQGDVILVLDSHCEVMTNWLPPLLNPIVEDYRTAVCPLIDIIAWDNFAYRPQDNGARGGFDWHFYYKRIPLSPEKARLLPQPFENPIMNGGLFAISRKFFWELGGYDSGLQIWGGEQYNLSFKIWQCGGRMLDAPCSRVGHVFRGTSSNRPAAKQKNFLSKNYKRVALTWMDEYIEALYKKKPELRSVDAGDITPELAIRDKLQCKSFKWFLENVAPDLMKLYPPFEDPDFANGTIRSVQGDRCLDTGGHSTGPLILHPCHGGSTQKFFWCWRHSIRIPGDQFCMESAPSSGKGPILYNCNNNESPRKQLWTYNPVTLQLQDRAKRQCLETDASSQPVMTTCREGVTSQQWRFQNVNKDRIQQVFPDLHR